MLITTIGLTLLIFPFCIVGTRRAHRFKSSQVLAKLHKAFQIDKKKRILSDKALPPTNMPEQSDLCKIIPSNEIKLQIEYPNAPMGSIWLNQSLQGDKYTKSKMEIDITNGGTLMGRRWVWDEGYFIDAQFFNATYDNLKKIPLPLCNCGSRHMRETQFHWKNSGSVSEFGRTRRSERSGTSTRMTSVLNELANGTLSPHTLISCDEYTNGPEHRFSDILPKEDVQPFSVRVSPDATFLADLHAHVCESEIIGFLGGHYSVEERCLYIQAAFPCKSTDREDSGQTDVEMDPVSQIYAREAIDTNGMKVVGWYHSHPTFQPDPSVTDIENQASYQQLFASSSESDWVPFVGLIVGTYDGRNPTSQSVMRWFHVRNQVTSTYKNVYFPMNLKTTDRVFRKTVERESEQVRQDMTSSGADIRRKLESSYLSCPLTKSSELEPFVDMLDSSLVYDTKRNDNGDSLNENNGCQGNDHDEHTERAKDTPFEKELIDTTTQGTTQTALLLSETMLNKDYNHEPSSWEFIKAQPLYFTEDEKSTINNLSIESDFFDVMGGLIWHAVEREQGASRSTAKHSFSLIPRSAPASSGAIFELLIRQSFTSFSDLEQKLYDVIHCAENSSSHCQRNASFHDNDAAITHNVDAIISHYSTNPKKVSPFASWSGAGDKGNITRGNALSSLMNHSKWRDLYLTKVLGMQRVEVNGGAAYEGGARKMKRGHKMTACLLKWASAMQLSPHFERTTEDSRNTLDFDHENKLHWQAQDRRPLGNSYCYFVAEVMRLIAAKWRENSGKESSCTQIKRTKRSNSIIPGSKEGNSFSSSASTEFPSQKISNNKAPVAKRGSNRECVSETSDSANIKSAKLTSLQLNKSSKPASSSFNKDNNRDWTCTKCQTKILFNKKRCRNCKSWRPGTRTNIKSKKSSSSEDDESIENTSLANLTRKMTKKKGSNSVK